MNLDTMTIEVLPDGTLKIETDEVSLANHTSAENLLREMNKLAGGPTAVRHKHGKHAQSHSHGHGHGNKAHQH